jgi:hypothetical protein
MKHMHWAKVKTSHNESTVLPLYYTASSPRASGGDRGTMCPLVGGYASASASASWDTLIVQSSDPDHSWLAPRTVTSGKDDFMAP